MKPKFSIGAERLMLGEKYVSNGHWMITRDALRSPMAPAALKPLLSCLTGTYYSGIKNGRDQETVPEMEQAIPARDGYLPISSEPATAKIRHDDEVSAFVFKCGDFEIGVNPKYVPIIRMGNAFAKDARSPVLILDGKTLNDGLVGLVMPMRIDQ